MSKYGYPYSLGSYWHDDYRCNHRLHEARAWAIRYKKLYEYAEGYRHGWQVQSEIEEELRKQAEQDSDYACAAYRDMYQQWAKAERNWMEAVGESNETLDLANAMIDERN